VPAAAATRGQWFAAATDGVGHVPVLVVLALSWVIGDALGGSGTPVSPTPVALLSLAAAVVTWWRPRLGARLLLAGVAYWFAATAAHHAYAPALPPGHVAHAAQGAPVWIDGLVLGDPDERGGRTRLSLVAERLSGRDGWRSTQGRVLLTIRHARQAWHAGDRLRARVRLRPPRNFGNPGEFDYVGYLARRGVYITAYANDDGGFERIGVGAGPLGRWLGAWRQGVGATFARLLPAREAGVLSALIIGSQAGVSRELRGAFNRAGVSHVLSISGLHIGMVAAVGYAVARWLLSRSRWCLLSVSVPKVAAVLSALPVLAYAGIAGRNVATVRAVLMVLVFIGAVLADRQRHLVGALAVAALLIMWTMPGASLDISFQLSFTAVLGLVFGVERLRAWWLREEEARLVRLRSGLVRLWRPVALSVFVSLSALASTSPLTAFHFNQISLVAPLANVFVVPLLGSAAVVLGLLAAVCYLVLPPLSAVCVRAAYPVLVAGVWLVDAFAALPFASLRCVTPSRVELALAYLGLLTLVRTAGRVRWALLGAVFLAAMADGAWWYADRFHHRDVRVTFLSVGTGDSAVVELPGGRVLLIDGGGLPGDGFDVGERIVAPFLWGRKIGRVDYVALSHPQWDHYGGLRFVAEHFAPREFWWTGATASSGRFQALEAALDARGVRRVVWRRGTTRRLGDALVRAELPGPNRA
jgi:competence protein ComEC